MQKSIEAFSMLVLIIAYFCWLLRLFSYLARFLHIIKAHDIEKEKEGLEA
jgi:hypothetical protein